MKNLLLFFCLLPLMALAQEEAATPAAVDTTIYDFADEAPRFPTPCETLDTTAAVKAECAQIGLLDYVNSRALYPAAAREQGISGMVVISFIVEKNGLINRPEIVRDPGGDLGIAALRSVVGMAREVRWRPAFKDGKPVRYRFNLPIRFRLEEPKPYVLTLRDTVYVEFSKPLTFTGNDGNLTAYFNENVDYPAVGEDSCSTGQMDVQILVRPDNTVSVQDIIDYNDLGTDFIFAATKAATQSFGQWSPAEYNGRPVTAAYDISFTFAPESAACRETLDNYTKAVQMIAEGQLLTQDSTTLDAGLLKMDEAVALFPMDGRFRILRGQARLDNNRLMGACEDLSLAKEIALINWYDGILPLICRETE
ncbi:TonB family protein [Lewinella sp. W8]|uniref:TonB family protein n=1 Tax=Lewinella sp. W8 TaxID=2528208 RepID=UPI0010687292|nr:TonB family protein [Lewinella sp. W8]MTB52984.1 TonB family protein [Lewinella sp. W8]